MCAVSTEARDLSTTLAVAAAASAAAGLVHAAAAGSHSDDTTLAWLFALCAVAQLGWAVAVVLRPHRFVIVAGIALNAGCVAVWALTRSVGLGGPFGAAEDVGFQDVLAAALAGVAVVGAGLALLPRRQRARLDVPAVAVASLIVLLLAVPAMAAGHTHADGHSHEAAGAVSDTHVHASGTAAHDHSSTASADPTGPLVSLDDPRLTSAQKQRATKLLTTTRAALAKFPDEASVVAGGYVWIGDGRRPGGFQHFVNRDYIRDGLELDPDAIESIVLQVQPDGTKKIASAMYILDRGKTLADAPDIAGSLTPWHDHQNLCWDDTGTRLAGIVVNGRCVPGGTFRGTSPMMHVWAENTPCGPFSGIEGHGGACQHTHTS
jgi:hypothetical protein